MIAVLDRADRTAYAEQLVRLASRMATPSAGHTVAMANRSDLSARIAAVLDRNQARGRAGTLRLIATTAAAIVLLVTISPLRAVGRSSAGDEALIAISNGAGVDRELPVTPSSVRDTLSTRSAATRIAPAPTARPQAATTTASAFEAISITKNDGTGLHRGPVLSGDKFTATNFQVLWLIQEAYGMDQYQILGGPSWIRDRTAYFDIAAKAPASTSKDQLRAMLRQLLADRFHLVVHIENRDTPVYALTLADASGTLGPKMIRATADCAALRAAAPPELAKTVIPCGYNMQVGRRAGRGASLDMLVAWLSGELREQVLDKTGLEGIFDIDLSYTPEQLRHHAPDRFPTVDPEGPSIFDAVQQQLGLKLERQAGMGDVLVVEGAELPTPD